MLSDVPSMAVSGEATAASVEVKSTLVARVIVSQKCLHAPYTCRSAHQHTYMRHIQRTHGGGEGGGGEGGGGEGGGEGGGQAAPCEPCVRNDTAGANAPTGGVSPDTNNESAATNHGLATAAMLDGDATRGDRGAAGEAGGGARASDVVHPPHPAALHVRSTAIAPGCHA